MTETTYNDPQVGDVFQFTTSGELYRILIVEDRRVRVRVMGSNRSQFWVTRANWPRICTLVKRGD